MRFFKNFAVCVAVLSLLSGCSSHWSQSQDKYKRAEVGQETRVEFGTILQMRQVELRPQTTGAGGLAGSVAGGVAASTIGSGSGKTAAVIGGAILGAIIGKTIEEAIDNDDEEKGMEYMIAKNSGETITIVQNVDPSDAPMKVGDRVIVQTDDDYFLHKRGSYRRVLPANHLPTQMQQPQGIVYTSPANPSGGAVFP